MKKNLREVATRGNAAVSLAKSVHNLGEKLIRATQWITENKADILATPVADLKKEAQIAGLCVLRRMRAAVERRLDQLEPLVREQFATMPEIKAGEPGHTITSGPFAVMLRNRAVNTKVMDERVVREVLREKGINVSRVMITPPPQMPYISEELVKVLVREGTLTEQDLDSCYRRANPSLELRVEVPDQLDAVIQKRLLGGLRY
jgi:hypothetical protein